jgi:AcrR family transcriptional regulator
MEATLKASRPEVVSERAVIAVDTRRALLEAAERLMAERGIRGVGLKEISVIAGQRNNSAAQYHFGDRANLVEAVFVNRMTSVNATRHQRLEELARRPKPSGIRPLVEVEVEPLLDVVGLGGGSWFACFLAQAFADDEYRHQLDLHHPVNGPTRALVQLQQRELAWLPARVRRRRLEYASITVVNVLAAYERAGRARGPRRSSIRAVASEITDAVVGLLEAPVTTTSGSS